ncbi:glycosyltransferase family 4 protein [Albidovulum sediminicola]|uniref:Glycosyltransferase family 4 protein n=1 Tax=Albidovulum sediminicola TaxID=2984331 RepID=A0ABT2Z718_9RHOB|nr:glycosyltransferase family 4 protein [Defluviimonas sp. WL0075]MCV2866929.1 glycosyltransferase family 4 protein [Defluviimonas sp. WL0075]
MKLLIVSAFFETHRGGAERVAGQLARHLSQNGIVVNWLAADASRPDEIPGVSLISVRANNWIEEKTGVPVPIWWPGAVRTAWRAVRGAEMVMLHDTLYLGNIATFLAARWYRRPIVIVQHVGAIRFTNRMFRALMWIGDKLVGRSMLASADQVVFISERIADEYREVGFRRPAKIVFNGVDTTVFTPPSEDTATRSQRAALDLADDVPVALFAGRFVARKGLELIRNMAVRRQDVAFVLAGWGPIDPRDWALDNVRVTLARTPEEMCALFRAADCLLLPSIGEGFPLVIQEALSTGLPVICSSETMAADRALREFVRNAPVDPGDLAAHTNRWLIELNAVLDDCAARKPEARRRLSEAVHARYGWPTTVARHLEVLRALRRA